jgi:hypothetical protein
MNQLTNRRNENMEKQYKKVGEISFDSRTPDKVCAILERESRQPRERIRLYYGDAETGKCWMEEHDIMGYVGRSTGSIKIPLLVHNARSSGGGAILDHCIVKITKGKAVLYRHPAFHMPVVSVEGTQVLFDNVLYANCQDNRRAQRLAAFMVGERNAK